MCLPGRAPRLPDSPRGIEESSRKPSRTDSRGRYRRKAGYPGDAARRSRGYWPTTRSPARYRLYRTRDLGGGGHIQGMVDLRADNVEKQHLVLRLFNREIEAGRGVRQRARREALNASSWDGTGVPASPRSRGSISGKRPPAPSHLRVCEKIDCGVRRIFKTKDLASRKRALNQFFHRLSGSVKNVAPRRERPRVSSFPLSKRRRQQAGALVAAANNTGRL